MGSRLVDPADRTPNIVSAGANLILLLAEMYDSVLPA
jgi:hypothetical protein